MIKKKAIFFILFIFFLRFLHSQQNNFYWENEFSLESGNIGKFEVINNNQLIGLLFAKNEKTKQIFFRYSLDGIKWNQKILLENDFYSNNPNGVDFSGAIDFDNNLYICYRTEQNKIEIEKFYFDSNFSKKEKIFESQSENVIYLPTLYATRNQEICFIFLENTNKDVKVRFKKIDKDGKIVVENTIADNFKSPLNPYLTEFNGILYVVFQEKINR